MTREKKKNIYLYVYFSIGREYLSMIEGEKKKIGRLFRTDDREKNLLLVHFFD
jgi:hypothetical protein